MTSVKVVTISSILLVSNKVPVAWRFEMPLFLSLLSYTLFLHQMFLTSALSLHSNKTIHCESSSLEPSTVEIPKRKEITFAS